MAQKSDIENLPFICRADHSFLPFFLRLIVSCTFSSLLGAKAEICGVLTSERGYFPTTLRPRKADLTTCLLNHCWKKVGPTLLCCGCESAEVDEEEEKNKNDNTAVKSFHLIAKVHGALNLPWCTGKPAENTLSPGAHAHSGALVLLSSSRLFSPRATDGLRSSSHSGCVRASWGCTPPPGSSADLPPHLRSRKAQRAPDFLERAQFEAMALILVRFMGATTESEPRHEFCLQANRADHRTNNNGALTLTWCCTTGHQECCFFFFYIALWVVVFFEI